MSCDYVFHVRGFSQPFFPLNTSARGCVSLGDVIILLFFLPMAIRAAMQGLVATRVLGAKQLESLLHLYHTDDDQHGPPSTPRTNVANVLCGTHYRES